MDKDIIIALDEGTSNAKAMAIDFEGNIITSHSLPLSILTPNEGWVEQDARLLINASYSVISKVISDIEPERIAGLAISVQRETAVGWYRSNGEPLNAAITWQCSRTAEFCESLRRDNLSEKIRSITGLPVAPLFSASKFKWLLESVPNGVELAKNGDICLGTVDSWLLWNLTGGKEFSCDYSNASRTQLLNIHTHHWDTELIKVFGIPESSLPGIKPSSGIFGYTNGNENIPDGIPILSMIGDSHAALFGHRFGEMGCVKATYGTGSSVMAPVTNVCSNIKSLASTIAWHDGHSVIYGLEGNIPHTGDGVAWMTEVTGLDSISKQELSEQLNSLPASVESTLGVYFIPALTGLGAPWWDDSARGVITGLSRGVERAHLIRASLEAITYQIADVITAMKQHSDFEFISLMVDGGPTKNDWLMQYQADLLGVSVLRSNVTELSAIGAALLALKAISEQQFEIARNSVSNHFEFKPNMERHERLQKRWAEWRSVLKNTLSK
ncbi:FGGY family carbohydrate kinase [Vibrio salinus]|uniref:FGGY family carbohydrate kinase n=1 Tax=Vibrio salinus TaxID=2899784 RepID=UPI001E4D0609|nr:FGGY-family carbohydrate kinase [Vibrio salinus]MCE0495987.1 FGGY-family carbohydrate kinase [Vibrio salinus]